MMKYEFNVPYIALKMGKFVYPWVKNVDFDANSSTSPGLQFFPKHSGFLKSFEFLMST